MALSCLLHPPHTAATRASLTRGTLLRVVVLLRALDVLAQTTGFHVYIPPPPLEIWGVLLPASSSIDANG